MIAAAPGTIVVYSDIACPWAHLAVHRLLAARRRLHLDDQVTLDHRAFPLEVANERATPWSTLAAEIPVVGGLDANAGWQVWQRPPSEWPVTTLLALEAVQAAKDQGLSVSERLDRALRRAFFAESKCISLRHVIIEVARGVDGLDAKRLTDALDAGQCRAAVLDQQRRSEATDVTGSPHVFLPDGSNLHNPGIEMHWEGEHGFGFPVVDKDNPAVYEELVRSAADH